MPQETHKSFFVLFEIIREENSKKSIKINVISYFLLKSIN